MAAVTGQLERTRQEVKQEEGSPEAVASERVASGFSSFSAATAPPSMEQKHANLTRMVFGRRVIEEALATTRITLEEEQGKYFFKLDPPMRADVVPWALAPAKKKEGKEDEGGDLPVAGKYPRLSLWSLAGKMGCPTWDLPAGAGAVGGACPGAKAAQTVILSNERRTMLAADGKLKAEVPGEAGEKPGWGEIVPVKIQDTICGSCYAYVGNYANPNTQAGEIIRYWWVKSCLTSKEGKKQLEDVLVRSILTSKFPVTPYQFKAEPRDGFAPSDKLGGSLKPVRVHSSGDFFDIEYFEVWINVANRVFRLDPTIRFWAPTRMWAMPNFTKQMEKRMDRLESDNFLVRASAYHFNDPAPGAIHPDNAVGSCSIYKEDDLRVKGGKDDRYDISCPIYDAKTPKNQTTCASAPPPAGSGREEEKHGCRACWLMKDKRINYQAHF